MGKFASAIFTPTHPEKLCGAKRREKIIYRSSWEYVLMSVFDNNPAVQRWASEPEKISYVNPLTRKTTHYVPDFFVLYFDKQKTMHAEIIEIKPLKQDPRYQGKVSAADRAAQAVNAAKWMAAEIWCRQRGYYFRVMTEEDLFTQTGHR